MPTPESSLMLKHRPIVEVSQELPLEECTHSSSLHSPSPRSVQHCPQSILPSLLLFCLERSVCLGQRGGRRAAPLFRRLVLGSTLDF